MQDMNPQEKPVNRDFYEGAGLVFMQDDMFTPPIAAYLKAEEGFWKAHLSGRGRVLEVGCGAGHNLVRLAPMVGELVGVDYAIQMVTQARARTRNLTNVRVIRGDAEKLGDCIDGQFECAFLAWNTFGNMQEEQHERILKQLRQVVTHALYFSVYRTGDIVMDARLAYYGHIDLEVTHIEGDHITVASGGVSMTAYAYPADYYESLGRVQGMGVRLHRISDIGMIVEMRVDGTS